MLARIQVRGDPTTPLSLLPTLVGSPASFAASLQAERAVGPADPGGGARGGGGGPVGHRPRPRTRPRPRPRPRRAGSIVKKGEKCTSGFFFFGQILVMQQFFFFGGGGFMISY